MRTLACFSVGAVLLTALCLTSAQERATSRTAAGQPVAPQRAKAAPEATPPNDLRKGTGPSDSSRKDGASRKLSPDEEAILKTAESFVKAYNEADAKAVAAHFTEDAQYVDADGNSFEGRAAIEQTLSRFFADNEGTRLQLEIEAIRMIAPGVAIEDGMTTVVGAKGERSHSHYLTIHVKSDGKWLAAAVREHIPQGEQQHRQKLQSISWLEGEWVDESDESIVTFRCRPVDGGNFLLREFTIVMEGHDVMSGSQRIGWDPLTGRLRAWTFDSAGGFFEGVWEGDGQTWVLTSTGVTADGQTASGASIFVLLNDHTLKWQAVDHEIGGVRLPDSEIYTLVRKGPPPETAEREAATTE